MRQLLLMKRQKNTMAVNDQLILMTYGKPRKEKSFHQKIIQQLLLAKY